MKLNIKLFTALAAVALSGCELSGDLKDGSETSSTPISELLNGAYGGLRNFQPQDNLLALTTHTSDELAGPTRGADWDDAGVWRVLHTHSWTPTHAYVQNVWTVIGSNSFNARNVICQGAEGETLGQSIFLRNFNDFILLDNYGVVQRRECGSDLAGLPTKIGRDEASEMLISELEESMSDMPTVGAPVIATADAARMLLMKLYLNRAVYDATEIDASGVTKALTGPYTFAAADMNKVIEYADEIISSGNYDLATNYYDNFIPANTETSPELIFVSENTDGGVSGAIRSRWHMTMHYNQTPSGWNGFVALTDLYNLYEESDMRRATDYEYLAESGTGINAGFLVGQQYDVDGNELTDRANNPLAFTPEFSLVETGSNLEVTGIRAVKYVPDFPSDDDLSDNDFVFFRYADVLLMKVEAILRGGTSGDSPLDIINEIRVLRGASALATVTLDDVLDERSRELYMEGWRRNDQVRFGTFLGTWQEKNTASGEERLLFPIPSSALATNPALVQNFGY